jgi:Fe-S-cluster containining protein
MSRATADKALTLHWMPSLIKAQAIMDSGVRLAVRQESVLRGAGPACGEQCGGCCSSRRAEATAVEMAGALWSLKRDTSESAAAALERFLAPPRLQDQGCPFLVEGACSAYSMRFLSCRQLVVFGRACSPGEDPTRSRRADLLTPLRMHAYKAYSLLLPHLGVPVPPSDPLELEAALKGCLNPAGDFSARVAASLLLTHGTEAAQASRQAPRQAA